MEQRYTRRLAENIRANEAHRAELVDRTIELKALGFTTLNRTGHMTARAALCAMTGLLMATVTPRCYAAQITVKGSSILIVGDINYGDFYNFEAATKPIYKPMTVHLHSRGGSILDAIGIGRVIRREGWVTYTEKFCNSACALIWMSGVNRFKAEGALIGFHRARVSVEDKSPSTFGDRAEADYLKGMGYNQQVIDFALKAPPSGMTYLTEADARKIGLAMTVAAPIKIAHVPAQPAPPAPASPANLGLAPRPNSAPPTN
jgi:hypothetical protein